MNNIDLSKIDNENVLIAVIKKELLNYPLKRPSQGQLIPGNNFITNRKLGTYIYKDSYIVEVSYAGGLGCNWIMGFTWCPISNKECRKGGAFYTSEELKEKFKDIDKLILSEDLKQMEKNYK